MDGGEPKENTPRGISRRTAIGGGIALGLKALYDLKKPADDRFLRQLTDPFIEVATTAEIPAIDPPMEASEAQQNLLGSSHFYDNRLHVNPGASGQDSTVSLRDVDHDINLFKQGDLSFILGLDSAQDAYINLDHPQLSSSGTRLLLRAHIPDNYARRLLIEIPHTRKRLVDCVTELDEHIDAAIFDPSSPHSLITAARSKSYGDFYAGNVIIKDQRGTHDVFFDRDIGRVNALAATVTTGITALELETEQGNQVIAVHKQVPPKDNFNSENGQTETYSSLDILSLLGLDADLKKAYTEDNHGSYAGFTDWIQANSELRLAGHVGDYFIFFIATEDPKTHIRPERGILIAYNTVDNTMKQIQPGDNSKTLGSPCFISDARGTDDKISEPEDS